MTALELAFNAAVHALPDTPGARLMKAVRPRPALARPGQPKHIGCGYAVHRVALRRVEFDFGRLDVLAGEVIPQGLSAGPDPIARVCERCGLLGLRDYILEYPGQRVRAQEPQTWEPAPPSVPDPWLQMLANTKDAYRGEYLRSDLMGRPWNPGAMET